MNPTPSQRLELTQQENNNFENLHFRAAVTPSSASFSSDMSNAERKKKKKYVKRVNTNDTERRG